MKTVRLCQAGDDSGSRRRRLGTWRRLSRRRHQPPGSDEGQHMPPAARRRHQPSSRPRPDRGSSRRRRAHRRAGPQCGSRARSRSSPGAFRPSPKRFCPERRRSFATPPRSAAISCSGRAAPTSTTSPAPATNAIPVRAVTPAAATTGCTPSWDGARVASRRTRLISACLWSRSTQLSRSRAGRAGRDIPLEMFHRLPGDAPDRESVLEPGEMIVAVRLPAEAAQFAAHARYLKVRERTSYAFAVVSAAAALRVERRYDQRGARSRSAAWRSSRGARAKPNRSCAAPVPTLRAFVAPPRRRSRRQSRPATTPSRSSWRAASWCGR